MTDLPPAHTIKRHGQWDHADDSCVLTYDDRFLRRKRLLTSHNRGFLVDLAHTESLNWCVWRGISATGTAPASLNRVGC